MGGGRENPMLISTPAIAGIGFATAKARSVVAKSNLFMCGASIFEVLPSELP
jgi:hypothetical protein